MSFLTNKRCYLSGPIQYSDTNVDWRPDVKKVLVENFKIDLFDPYADPKQQWVPILLKAQEEKDYDKMVEICSKFVRKDLCMVDRSDFIIAYLPYKKPTVGTHHEIINSNNAKKPTLLVTDNDICEIPLWYYGFIPKEFMFAGWESLYKYLNDVNDGKYKNNNRWSYIYGEI